MQFYFYKTIIQVATVLFFFLVNTNLNAQSGFYEISTPLEEEILGVAISDYGVCWIQTLTKDKSDENRFIDRPIPIYIKALYFDHDLLTENTIWSSGLEKPNTVIDNKCGVGYLALIYTNPNLFPRCESINASVVNNRWILTNIVRT